jgi:hypothetical protein
MSCVFFTGSIERDFTSMAAVAFPTSFFRDSAAVPVTTSASRDRAASRRTNDAFAVWPAARVIGFDCDA